MQGRTDLNNTTRTVRGSSLPPDRSPSNLTPRVGDPRRLGQGVGQVPTPSAALAGGPPSAHNSGNGNGHIPPAASVLRSPSTVGSQHQRHPHMSRARMAAAPSDSGRAQPINPLLPLSSHRLVVGAEGSSATHHTSNNHRDSSHHRDSSTNRQQQVIGGGGGGGSGSLSHPNHGHGTGGGPVAISKLARSVSMRGHGDELDIVSEDEGGSQQRVPGGRRGGGGRSQHSGNLQHPKHGGVNVNKNSNPLVGVLPNYTVQRSLGQAPLVDQNTRNGLMIGSSEDHYPAVQRAGQGFKGGPSVPVGRRKLRDTILSHTFDTGAAAGNDNFYPTGDSARQGSIAIPARLHHRLKRSHGSSVIADQLLGLKTDRAEMQGDGEGSGGSDKEGDEANGGKLTPKKRTCSISVVAISTFLFLLTLAATALLVVLVPSRTLNQVPVDTFLTSSTALGRASLAVTSNDIGILITNINALGRVVVDRALLLHKNLEHYRNFEAFFVADLPIYVPQNKMADVVTSTNMTNNITPAYLILSQTNVTTETTAAPSYTPVPTIDPAIPRVPFNPDNTFPLFRDPTFLECFSSSSLDSTSHDPPTLSYPLRDAIFDGDYLNLVGQYKGFGLPGTMMQNISFHPTENITAAHIDGWISPAVLLMLNSLSCASSNQDIGAENTRKGGGFTFSSLTEQLMFINDTDHIVGVRCDGGTAPGQNAATNARVYAVFASNATLLKQVIDSKNLTLRMSAYVYMEWVLPLNLLSSTALALLLTKVTVMMPLTDVPNFVFPSQSNIARAAMNLDPSLNSRAYIDTGLDYSADPTELFYRIQTGDSGAQVWMTPLRYCSTAGSRDCSNLRQTPFHGVVIGICDVASDGLTNLLKDMKGVFSASNGSFAVDTFVMDPSADFFGASFGGDDVVWTDLVNSARTGVAPNFPKPSIPNNIGLRIVEKDGVTFGTSGTSDGWSAYMPGYSSAALTERRHALFTALSISHSAGLFPSLIDTLHGPLAASVTKSALDDEYVYSVALLNNSRFFSVSIFSIKGSMDDFREYTLFFSLALAGGGVFLTIIYAIVCILLLWPVTNLRFAVGYWAWQERKRFLKLTAQRQEEERKRIVDEMGPEIVSEPTSNRNGNDGHGFETIDAQVVGEHQPSGEVPSGTIALQALSATDNDALLQTIATTKKEPAVVETAGPKPSGGLWGALYQPLCAEVDKVRTAFWLLRQGIRENYDKRRSLAERKKVLEAALGMDDRSSSSPPLGPTVATTVGDDHAFSASLQINDDPETMSTQSNGMSAKLIQVEGDLFQKQSEGAKSVAPPLMAPKALRPGEMLHTTCVVINIRFKISSVAATRRTKLFALQKLQQNQRIRRDGHSTSPNAAADNGRTADATMYDATYFADNSWLYGKGKSPSAMAATKGNKYSSSGMATPATIATAIIPSVAQYNAAAAAMMDNYSLNGGNTNTNSSGHGSALGGTAALTISTRRNSVKSVSRVTSQPSTTVGRQLLHPSSGGVVGGPVPIGSNTANSPNRQLTAAETAMADLDGPISSSLSATSSVVCKESFILREICTEVIPYFHGEVIETSPDGILVAFVVRDSGNTSCSRRSAKSNNTSMVHPLPAASSAEAMRNALDCVDYVFNRYIKIKSSTPSTTDNQPRLPAKSRKMKTIDAALMRSFVSIFRKDIPLVIAPPLPVPQRPGVAKSNHPLGGRAEEVGDSRSPLQPESASSFPTIDRESVTSSSHKKDKRSRSSKSGRSSSKRRQSEGPPGKERLVAPQAPQMPPQTVTSAFELALRGAGGSPQVANASSSRGASLTTAPTSKLSPQGTQLQSQSQSQSSPMANSIKKASSPQRSLVSQPPKVYVGPILKAPLYKLSEAKNISIAIDSSTCYVIGVGESGWEGGEGNVISGLKVLTPDGQTPPSCTGATNPQTSQAVKRGRRKSSLVTGNSCSRIREVVVAEALERVVKLTIVQNSNYTYIPVIASDEAASILVAEGPAAEFTLPAPDGTIQMGKLNSTMVGADNMASSTTHEFIRSPPGQQASVGGALGFGMHHDSNSSPLQMHAKDTTAFGGSIGSDPANGSFISQSPPIKQVETGSASCFVHYLAPNGDCYHLCHAHRDTPHALLNRLELTPVGDTTDRRNNVHFMKTEKQGSAPPLNINFVDANNTLAPYPLFPNNVAPPAKTAPPSPFSGPTEVLSDDLSPLPLRLLQIQSPLSDPSADSSPSSDNKSTSNRQRHDANASKSTQALTGNPSSVNVKGGNDACLFSAMGKAEFCEAATTISHKYDRLSLPSCLVCGTCTSTVTEPLGARLELPLSPQPLSNATMQKSSSYRQMLQADASHSLSRLPPSGSTPALSSTSSTGSKQPQVSFVPIDWSTAKRTVGVIKDVKTLLHAVITPTVYYFSEMYVVGGGSGAISNGGSSGTVSSSDCFPHLGILVALSSNAGQSTAATTPSHMHGASSSSSASCQKIEAIQRSNQYLRDWLMTFADASRIAFPSDIQHENSHTTRTTYNSPAVLTDGTNRFSSVTASGVYAATLPAPVAAGEPASMDELLSETSLRPHAFVKSASVLYKTMPVTPEIMVASLRTSVVIAPVSNRQFLLQNGLMNSLEFGGNNTTPSLAATSGDTNMLHPHKISLAIPAGLDQIYQPEARQQQLYKSLTNANEMLLKYPGHPGQNTPEAAKNATVNNRIIELSAHASPDLTNLEHGGGPTGGGGFAAPVALQEIMAAAHPPSPPLSQLSSPPPPAIAPIPYRLHILMMLTAMNAGRYAEALTMGIEMLNTYDHLRQYGAHMPAANGSQTTPLQQMYANLEWFKAIVAKDNAASTLMFNTSGKAGPTESGHDTAVLGSNMSVMNSQQQLGSDLRLHATKQPSDYSEVSGFMPASRLAEVAADNHTDDSPPPSFKGIPPSSTPTEQSPSNILQSRNSMGPKPSPLQGAMVSPHMAVTRSPSQKVSASSNTGLNESASVMAGMAAAAASVNLAAASTASFEVLKPHPLFQSTTQHPHKQQPAGHIHNSSLSQSRDLYTGQTNISGTSSSSSIVCLVPMPTMLVRRVYQLTVVCAAHMAKAELVNHGLASGASAAAAKKEKHRKHKKTASGANKSTTSSTDAMQSKEPETEISIHPHTRTGKMEKSHKGKKDKLGSPKDKDVSKITNDTTVTDAHLPMVLNNDQSLPSIRVSTAGAQSSHGITPQDDRSIEAKTVESVTLTAISTRVSPKDPTKEVDGHDLTPFKKRTDEKKASPVRRKDDHFPSELPKATEEEDDSTTTGNRFTTYETFVAFQCARYRGWQTENTERGAGGNVFNHLRHNQTPPPPPVNKSSYGQLEIFGWEDAEMLHFFDLGSEENRMRFIEEDEASNALGTDEVDMDGWLPPDLITVDELPAR